MSNTYQEAKMIAEKYKDKSETVNKMDMLRQLDASTKKVPSIIAMVIGIFGALIVGVGMCCTMVWTDFFVLGIVIGILGFVVCGINYPIFKKLVVAKKAEITPQILQLSNEIMSEAK